MGPYPEVGAFALPVTDLTGQRKRLRECEVEKIPWHNHQCLSTHFTDGHPSKDNTRLQATVPV